MADPKTPDSTSQVWLNGRLQSTVEARIDPRDRAFLLGDGLFETILFVHGFSAFFEQHMARLSASALALRIPMPYDPMELRAACADLLRTQGLDTERASIRISLSRGPAPRGPLPPRHPEPTVLITASALGDPNTLRRPAALHIASTRVAEASIARRHKTSSYIESVLARMEAKEAGADEALLLNSAGRIAEASAANIFVLRGRDLITPAIEEGALPGITRKWVLDCVLDCDQDIAPTIGSDTPCPIPDLNVREAHLTVEDLASADLIFLTSSLIGPRQASIRIHSDRASGAAASKIAKMSREIGEGRPARSHATAPAALLEWLQRRFDRVTRSDTRARD